MVNVDPFFKGNAREQFDWTRVSKTWLRMKPYCKIIEGEFNELFNHMIKLTLFPIFLVVELCTPGLPHISTLFRASFHASLI